MSQANKHLTDTPYKGLVPYSVDDAPFFFGREADEEIITANLMAHRLTLLYGPSGVGKSSVLHAGVAHHLHQLAQQNITERGTPEHIVVVFNSWRDDPLTGLVNCIRDAIAQVLNHEMPEQVSPSPGPIANILKTWAERVNSELIIVLDQFEEYFLYHPQEDGPGTFAFEFPAAINHPFLRASFLISIRDDALAKLDRFKGRIANLFDNYLRIEHLDREAARAAIEKPLEQYNNLLDAKNGDKIFIEPPLVEAVLDQVKTGQLALSEAGRGVVGNSHIPARTRIETPYLQLVMTRLWNEEMQRGSHALQLKTLQRLGGAERIVRTHLDDAISTLKPNEEEAAARAFHYLVTPSGTKIAHTILDLAEFAHLPQEQLIPILDKLSASNLRILRPVAPPPDQRETLCYEIFHDVLAPAILDWRTRRIQAQERAEAERRAEELRRQAEEKAKTAARLRRLAVALAFVSLVVVAAAIFAWMQRRQALLSEREAVAAKHAAERHAHLADSLRVAELAARETAEAQRTQAESAKIQSARLRSRELAAEANNNLDMDPELGILLALQAVSMTYSLDRTVTPEAHDALNRAAQASHIRFTLSGHTNWARGVSFSLDGTRLATASMDGTAIIWDAASGRKLFAFSDPAVALYGLAFSPDGGRLATAGVNGTAKVWDVASKKVLLTLSGHNQTVNSIAYSPDGKRLATASTDGKAKIWEASSGQALLTLSGHTGEVNSVAFSPDGKRLATSSADGKVKVWDALSGAELRTISSHTATVYSVAFSPDGKRLATASADWKSKIKIWDANSGQNLLTISGHSGLVNSVAFNSDGKILATAGSDGKVKIWSAASGQELLTLSGHTAAVLGIAFSATGDRLATASADKKVKIWDASAGEEIFVLSGHSAAVKGVSFSPDRKRLATASADKTAIIWDAASGQALLVLSGHL
ncbi:MAG: eIF2A-related protein, partial [bacterium]